MHLYEGREMHVCNVALEWQNQADEDEESAGVFLQRWCMAGTLCCWTREKGEVSGFPEHAKEGTLSWCFPSSCHSFLAQPLLLLPDQVLPTRQYLVLFLFCLSQSLIKV